MVGLGCAPVSVAWHKPVPLPTATANTLGPLPLTPLSTLPWNMGLSLHLLHFLASSHLPPALCPQGLLAP